MVFKVVIIYFSLRGRLATLAHVIAQGAQTIPGAEVSVYRIKDPVRGDDPDKFAEAVLAAPVVTPQVLLAADCIIIGAPGRQGGFAGEVRLFLDSMAEFQNVLSEGSTSQLMGKVGAAFTSVGGQGRGFGGQEVILQQFHATFLQHGMVVVGVPPQPAMSSEASSTPYVPAVGPYRMRAQHCTHVSTRVPETGCPGQWRAIRSWDYLPMTADGLEPDRSLACRFGVVMGGTYRCEGGKTTLHENEVKLAYSQGSWAARVTKQMHDRDSATTSATGSLV